MRELCSISDYILQNYSEAVFLLGIDSKEKSISYDKAQTIIHKLRKIRSKSVVITSMNIEDQIAVMEYDFNNDKCFMLPYENISINFPGTGDIFSAVMMGKVLLGKPLKISVQSAMDYMKKLIILNKDNEDKFKGIPIEAYLDKM